MSTLGCHSKVPVDQIPDTTTGNPNNDNGLTKEPKKQEIDHKKLSKSSADNDDGSSDDDDMLDYLILSEIGSRRSSMSDGANQHGNPSPVSSRRSSFSSNDLGITSASNASSESDMTNIANTPNNQYNARHRTTSESSGTFETPRGAQGDGDGTPTPVQQPRPEHSDRALDYPSTPRRRSTSDIPHTPSIRIKIGARRAPGGTSRREESPRTLPQPPASQPSTSRQDSRGKGKKANSAATNSKSAQPRSSRRQGLRPNPKKTDLYGGSVKLIERHTKI